MYGLDQLVFEKLKCEQGELDWGEIQEWKLYCGQSIRIG